MINQSFLEELYPNIGDDFELKGTLTDNEYNRLKKCLLKSDSIKNRIKRILAN